VSSEDWLLSVVLTLQSWLAGELRGLKRRVCGLQAAVEHLKKRAAGTQKARRRVIRSKRSR
jgi:hypothetical protein